MKVNLVGITAMCLTYSLVLSFVWLLYCWLYNTVPTWWMLGSVVVFFLGFVILYAFWGKEAFHVKQPLYVSDLDAEAVRYWIQHLTYAPVGITLAMQDEVEYTRHLITMFINKVPGWKEVNPMRYKGIVDVIDDHTEGAQICRKHGKDIGLINGFHLLRQNVSFVFKSEVTSREGFIEALIHEQLHSYTSDESMTTYATLWLMLFYGTKEESEHAKKRIFMLASPPIKSAYDRATQFFYESFKVECYMEECQHCVAGRCLCTELGATIAPNAKGCGELVPAK